MKLISTILFILLWNPLKGQDFVLNNYKTIPIPDSLFIGEVSFLDIYDDKLLITDTQLNQILLFDNINGWTKLNPAECYPGFNFSPIEAHFNKDGKIFLTNSGIWGFRYDSDQKCLGEANRKFRAPQRFDFNKNIVGISNDNQKTFVTGWDETGLPIKLYFSFENKYKNADNRLNLGGVVEDSQNIYVVNSLEPILYKYEKINSSLKKREFHHSSYEKLTNDLPENINSPNFMKKAQELFSNYSMNYYLFSINEFNLALVVRKSAKERRGYNYHCYIFSKSNLELVEYKVFKKKIVFIGKDELVLLSRDVIDGESEVINLEFYNIGLN